ncbi:MAG TPA: hypothetical protein VL633_07880 [Bacteroidota bacterium]|nr:hypothetical protein [Bacteroidota bacterium]
MKIALLILLTFAATCAAPSQSTGDSTAQFVFLPGGLHFAPLKAHMQEPRIGVFKFLDASEMKVDVGNSIDLFGLNFSHARLTAGIDFFAYAFVTGAQGLRLQIDAIDGFFGGNLTYSGELSGEGHDKLYARLRVLHQSAHVVDGHYLPATNSWIDNRSPIPFTRDFGEMVLAHAIIAECWSVRYYGGLSYATLVRPSDIERFAYLGGTEISRKIGALWEQPANLYASYNLSLDGVPVYAASHDIQLGVKFGEFYKKGPSVFLMYHTGRHLFGEYYNEPLTTIGAGFTVEFF